MRNCRIVVDGRTFTYLTCDPCADNEAVAEWGQRLMLLHDKKESRLFIAARGVLCSGIVLGTHAQEV